MSDKPHTSDPKPVPDAAVVPASTGNSTPSGGPPKRSPGHRGADVRDTVAEMAAKAQEISQEAGSKMASAMRDVISAAAGLASFAVDSARDLVQYMVRRGQMTQEEADKLIREAEEAAAKRNINLPPPPSKMPKPVPAPPVLVAAPVAVAPPPPAPVAAIVPPKPAPKPVAPAPAPAAVHAPHAHAPAHPPAAAKPAAKKAAPPAKTAVKKAPAKPAASASAKKKPAAKKR